MDHKIWWSICKTPNDKIEATGGLKWSESWTKVELVCCEYPLGLPTTESQMSQIECRLAPLYHGGNVNINYQVQELRIKTMHRCATPKFEHEEENVVPELRLHHKLPR